VLPLDGDRKPVPFVKSEFTTQQGQFSPNGRWVAYRSMESGRTEIYVQGFTLDSSQARGKWQVSVAGGELPRWRRDSKELFYHFGDGYFAVDVKTDGASFEAGIPRPLFQVPTVSSNQPSSAPPHLWLQGTASGSWSWRKLRRQAMRPSRSWSTGDRRLRSLGTPMGRFDSRWIEHLMANSGVLDG
jgi:hypothetical protein